MIEEDVTDYGSTSWSGLFTRAGTPAGAVDAINRAINEGLRNQATIARLTTMGVEPTGGSPVDFKTYVIRRSEETGVLIRAAGITAG